MPKYTMSDIKRADELSQQGLTRQEVAERIGCHRTTLRAWEQQGLIDLPDRRGHHGKPDPDLVARVDRLWDIMPATDIADMLDEVTLGQIRHWSQRDLISTEVDWAAETRRRRAAKRAARAVRLVIRQGRTQREAARMMGVSESAISRYICEFKSSSQ